MSSGLKRVREEAQEAAEGREPLMREVKDLLLEAIVAQREATVAQEQATLAQKEATAEFLKGVRVLERHMQKLDEFYRYAISEKQQVTRQGLDWGWVVTVVLSTAMLSGGVVFLVMRFG